MACGAGSHRKRQGRGTPGAWAAQPRRHPIHWLARPAHVVHAADAHDAAYPCPRGSTLAPAALRLLRPLPGTGSPQLVGVLWMVREGGGGGHRGGGRGPSQGVHPTPILPRRRRVQLRGSATSAPLSKLDGVSYGRRSLTRGVAFVRAGWPGWRGAACCLPAPSAFGLLRSACLPAFMVLDRMVRLANPRSNGPFSRNWPAPIGGVHCARSVAESPVSCGS